MLEQMAKERVLLKQIREKCNKTPQPGVSIIVSTNKLKYIDNILMNYMRSVYPNKELIIILNNNKLNINNCKLKSIGLKDVQIFQLDERCALGKCLNFGIEQTKFDYITKMDDDDYYAPNYLKDLMNVFKYTDAQVTGKASHLVYFEGEHVLRIRQPNNENRYTSFISGSTILAKKEVFDRVKFKSLECSEDREFCLDCVSAGIKMYSADIFNYIYMRHKNLLDHTWQSFSEEDSNNFRPFIVTRNFIPFLIV